MRKMMVFLLLVFLIFTFQILADNQNNGDHLTYELFQASPSVIMAKHAYGSNITCIASANGLYFVDCGMKTELAEKFRTEMEIKFQKKTKALLMTHSHIDHYLGMGAFSDVPVLAAAAGDDMWDRQLAIKFDDRRIGIFTNIFPKFKESIHTAKPFKPTVWLEPDTGLIQGDKNLSYSVVGGHSKDCLAFYLKSENVLVCGDLVQVDQYPYFGDPTGDVFSWINTFKSWEKLPIEKVCAGHGNVVDKTYITTMRDYFESLVTVLKKLKTEKLEPRQVVRHQKLPKQYWPDTKPRPQWFDYCIASLYQKL